VKRLLLALSAIVVGVAASSCAVGVRQPATSITQTGATLNGKVLSTTGGPGSYYIEYGTTLARTERTPTRTLDFVVNESEPVSEPVDGLEPGTTYHFAVCAEDSENAGDAFCSPDQTFTTRPTGDFISGSGNVIGADFTLTVHASSTGQNPTGFITTRSSSNPNFNFDATPTCLNVSGSSATTGYRIDTGSRTGEGFMAAFTDNGSSGVDQALWYIFLPDPPADCPLPTAPPPGSNIGPANISGDIEVVDAPSPTSSDR
jgi:hypothetical protein